MTERRVAAAEEIAEGTVVVVDVDGVEVGVLRAGGELRAFENRCPHQGGPVCYGRVIGHHEAVLDDRRHVVGERLSRERFDLVCPWHGWSYDTSTGENVGDRHFRLKRWDLAVRDGSVYLIGPSGAR